MVSGKKRTLVSGGTGVISTILGVIGGMSLCFCTFPLVGMALAAVGMASFLVFIYDYYVVFLVIGMASMTLSVCSVWKGRKRKVCRKVCPVPRNSTGKTNK